MNRPFAFVLTVLLGLLTTVPSASGQGADVEVTLEQFGLGSTFRPGDVTPMRLQLTSNLSEPTSVWVQWQVPNADGDICEYGRSLTLTPGQPTNCWLYAPLAPSTTANTVWPVQVHREVNGVPGEEIGGARFSPSLAGNGSQRFDPIISVIGVVGRQRMGLDGYAVPGPRGRPLASHEETRIVSGILPEELPDRWFGYWMFDAIAWGDGTQNPPNIGIDQADALMEYVQRGGHLIISLPTVGNPWGLGALGGTPFEALLPLELPERTESVPIEDLLPVLSKSKTSRSDNPLDARFFGRIDAYEPLDNNYYQPHIALPDGRILVVQRTYGHGRITVIGLDVASGMLLSQGLPEADVFWNRILGRRVDTPTLAQQTAIGTANRLTRQTPNENLLGSGNLFVQPIQHDQSASIGIMLAFVLFGAYWFLAGLGTFYGPKYYKQEKHSWVAFAAMAGLFTTIAWGAVAAVRPSTIRVKHFTILDHIAREPQIGSHNPDRGDNDPQLQHATSYMSAFLPGYQATNLTIPSAYGDNVMFSWEPPIAGLSKFPDVDRYRVDVGRNFAAMTIPSRSTTTRLQVEWQGAIDPAWGGLLREDPNNPIAVDVVGGRETLSGSIISELPGPLTRVTVFWIKSQRTQSRRLFSSGEAEEPWIIYSQSGQMLNTGNTWGPPSPAILPGDRIPLEIRGGTILSPSIDDNYIDPYVSAGPMAFNSGGATNISDQDRQRYLEMLTMFSQLTPPKYLVEPSNQNQSQNVSFSRELARRLDLSAWFTGPCLLVMGWVEDSALPIPLQAGGRDGNVESTGLTVIRWIFPLDLKEEVAFGQMPDD